MFKLQERDESAAQFALYPLGALKALLQFSRAKDQDHAWRHEFDTYDSARGQQQLELHQDEKTLLPLKGSSAPAVCPHAGA